MPPSSAAVKSPARRQGGRAGRNGQQTTGPHAPTVNLRRRAADPSGVGQAVAHRRRQVVDQARSVLKGTVAVRPVSLSLSRRAGETGRVMTLPGALLRSLAGIVGEPHVLTGDAAAGFAVDWTGRFRGQTPAVVRPGDTAEVAAVLALCTGAGVPVVPQGGNTGLVGGGVPLHGEVVLSLTRLNRLGPVDHEAAQVTAGAGVTLRQVADADPGLDLPILIASRDSATVGGAVATNAGGLRVLRFGPMRAQLRGIDAVLADGTVVSHLAGLVKDNAGYDYPSLLAGSEGTLAVITAARLRLVPRLRDTVTALAGVGGLDELHALAC